MRIQLLLLLALCTSCQPQPEVSTWEPPPKPDPELILKQARNDADAEQYADALAKHIWFHEHALEHDPGLYGVRLSFALHHWRELGQDYSPAQKKLEELRQEAEAKIRTGQGDRHTFNDLAALNDLFNDRDQTREIFVWLDANRPDLAKQVYPMAEAALIEGEKYQLCGKYIDPETSFERIVESYQQLIELGIRTSDNRVKEKARESFAEKSARLVALLTLNDRKAEAERVVTRALNIYDDPAFRQLLEKARQGSLP